MKVVYAYQQLNNPYVHYIPEALECKALVIYTSVTLRKILTVLGVTNFRPKISCK